MTHTSMQQVRHAHPIWFSADTMKFFNSIVETDLIEGQYFVTSERMELDHPKRFTIRSVKRRGRIKTIGDMQQYKSRQGARAGITAIIDSTKD